VCDLLSESAPAVGSLHHGSVPGIVPGTLRANDREVDTVESRDVIFELFDRIDQHVAQVVDGLDAEQLHWTPAPGTNSIGWLVWHLTRVQDSHVAEILHDEQVWVTGDHAARVGVDADPANSGYGHSAAEAAAIRPDGSGALLDYFEAVADRTRGLLESLDAERLDEIVDRRWDPPVTLGVRLVSIADDDIQHAGQAAYVRGLLPS
jgi:hypothetical protein